MTLNDLTTEFKRQRVITYSANGKKAVYHWKNLQNVSGNVYRGETIYESYNNHCELYVMYENIPVALFFSTARVDYTLDEVMSMVKRSRYDTLENYMALINERLNKPDHFRFTEIEFSKHIDPSLEVQMWESRKRYGELALQRNEERRKAEKEKETEYVNSMNAKAQEIIDAAIEVFKSGNGEVENSEVVIYTSQYHAKAYSLINYLAKKYGYNIPIKTQGWINGNLRRVVLKDGNCVSVNYLRPKGGKCSTTIHDHVSNLVKIIKEEK